MELREYLDILRQQIRCEKAGDMVVEEVKNHIEDQACAYMTEGMDETQAMEEAVLQMGDPVEAGVALDRIHRPKIDWKLVAIAAVLSIAGLFIQYLLCHETGDYSIFWNQCAYTAAGIVIMIAVCLADYSIIGKYAFGLWGILTGFVLLTALFGPVINGSHLYIKHYIYLYVPVFAGILYHYRNGGYLALLKCGFIHVISMTVSMMAVTIPVCLDVTAICLLMISMAVWKGWFSVRKKVALSMIWMSAVFLPALCLVLGIVRLNAYQIERYRTIINPYADPDGRGYIPGIIREALRQSTWLKEGGLSLQDRLGSVNSDYLLIQLISRYGIITAVVLLALVAVFLFHIFRISGNQKNQLGQMTGLGCSMVFAVQSIHYVALNLGTGVMSLGMPFLSYGKSGVFVTFLLLGLLLGIYRYKDITSERKPSYRERFRIRIEKV